MKTGLIEASVMEPNPEHVLPFEVWTGLLKAVSQHDVLRHMQAQVNLYVSAFVCVAFYPNEIFKKYKVGLLYPFG